MTLLDARELRYRHSAGAPEAVAGVTLRLPRGEVVGVIGPNAAGKSTLARLCCGLLTPQPGGLVGGARMLLVPENRELQLDRRHAPDATCT